MTAAFPEHHRYGFGRRAAWIGLGGLLLLIWIWLGAYRVGIVIYNDTREPINSVSILFDKKVADMGDLDENTSRQVSFRSANEAGVVTLSWQADGVRRQASWAYLPGKRFTVRVLDSGDAEVTQSNSLARQILDLIFKE